ncbi:MAG: FAD-binding oxidoreductase [Gloeocapsa sp. DLM2.Bin57]|nr:MAG: FAD-binding oxidoreductase [Gloeocapsa sp. DLM2.Bin57]
MNQPSDSLLPVASCLLPCAAHQIIAWDNLDPDWQAKIKSISNHNPPYFISPDDQVILSEVIEYANKHQYSILTCGQGSKLNWGGKLSKPVELVVSTQKLNRIVEHALEDLTVTVEAGVKLVDLQQILQQAKQFLPLDPSYPETATIGGIIATADSGSWRQRYGGVRDLLLGISFVRADGKIASAGGRVVKNVAGYDLMKLFTGSYGTLGIISQATFRVYPIPEASLTIILTGELNHLNQARQIIINSGLTPTAIDFISATVVKALDISSHPGLILRWQTIPESINQQVQQIETIAKELNLSSLTYQDEPEKNLWQRLTKIKESPNLITCKIGLMPNKVGEFLQEYAQLTNNQSLAIIHARSGLGTIAFSQWQPEIRRICENKQGFLTILTAPNTLKENTDIWGYTGNGLTIMEKLKTQFDPNYILNPGRFLGNI